MFCDFRMVLHRTCGRCRCTPVSIRVVTMRRCTAWPEHSPFWACLSTVLASCAHSTCGLCRCDDASIAPSFVIHSHLLDGIATSVCSLPPFLPASDLCLPNARLGKVLLLHHLESKTFTYRDTQLSKYIDLAAHPPVSSERVAHTACSGLSLFQACPIPAAGQPRRSHPKRVPGDQSPQGYAFAASQARTF